MSGSNGRSGNRTVRPELAPAQLEHLLKVAESIAHDASGVWADVWGELKPHVTPEGIVLPPMERGFIPGCGWPEFLERLWLLKHYVDSISRICGETH